MRVLPGAFLISKPVGGILLWCYVASVIGSKPLSLLQGCSDDILALPGDQGQYTFSRASIKVLHK